MLCFTYTHYYDTKHAKHIFPFFAKVGEIDSNEFNNNSGYINVLEGSLFNTSLSSLIIATIWFFVNLAMIVGVLLKRSR